MLIATGTIDMNLLVDGMIKMAQDQNTIHELNEEKGHGSWTHTDGWGIAYLDENDIWTVEKSTLPIAKDPLVDRFRSITPKAAILHVRKKMGSETAYHNTHPFQIERENPGSYVFCHNGYIEEEIFYDEKSFSLKGETDSEQLFYSILTDLDEGKYVKSIRKNFRRYRKLTGTNIILSSKNASVVAIRENHFPLYYQMQMGKKEGMLIISSERINIPEVKWEPLEQNDIVYINHVKSSSQIHKYTPSMLEKMRKKIFMRKKSAKVYIEHTSG